MIKLLQLTSEVRTRLICDLARGRYCFELWWDKHSKSCSSYITHLYSSSSPAPSFPAHSTHGVTGQDWWSKVASLVLRIPCHWGAAQGSCCSSPLSWQPCLKTWIQELSLNSVAISAAIAAVLWSPRFLELILKLDDGFRNRLQERVFSMHLTFCIPVSHISRWTPQFLVFVSHEVLTMQPSWAALGVTGMPQTNSGEEQGEPSHSVSSELSDCVSQKENYMERN